MSFLKAGVLLLSMFIVGCTSTYPLTSNEALDEYSQKFESFKSQFNLIDDRVFLYEYKDHHYYPLAITVSSRVCKIRISPNKFGLLLSTTTNEDTIIGYYTHEYYHCIDYAMKYEPKFVRELTADVFSLLIMKKYMNESYDDYEHDLLKLRKTFNKDERYNFLDNLKCAIKIMKPPDDLNNEQILLEARKKAKECANIRLP